MFLFLVVGVPSSHPMFPFSVVSGPSSHMIGMRGVFLSVLEIDSNYYVACGVDTIHVVTQE